MRSLVALLVCTLAASPVLGDGRARVRLELRRGAGAERCPDEETIRRGVAARLGYDPFDEAATRTVAATFERSGRALRAKVVARDAAGEVAGQRTLSSRLSDCQELARATELALAIAIDPIRAVRPVPASMTAASMPAPPSPPASTAALPPAPPVAPLSPVSRPAPRAVPLRYHAHLGVHAAFGAAPAGTMGANLQVGVGRGALSLRLEGRADVPASAQVESGRVSAALLMGALLPCLHHGWLAACGLVGAGMLRSAGHELVDARQATDAYVALGGRLAVEVPLKGVLVLAVHADLMAPLVRTTLRVDAAQVWSTPPIGGAFGVSLGADFL